MSRPVAAALTWIIREASDAARRDTASGPTLLARFAATRDEEAFADLVRLHGPLVWGVCHRVLRNPHDAEDAFQATFLVLARKADRIANPDRLSAWLHGVALRAARKLKELDGRRREVAALEACEPEAPLDERDEIWAALDEEIARLPAKLRQPIVLCRLQGQTYAEAARQLGCSVTAVFERLERAAEMLRARLTRRGVTAAGCATVAAWLDGTQALAEASRLPLAATSVEPSPRAAAVADAVVRSMSGSMAFRVAGLALASALVAGTAIALAPVEVVPAKRATSVVAGKAVDCLGDPLPAGALVRIGTERLRATGRGSLADVAVLPDNRTLVSAHCENHLRFWSLPDGQNVATLPAPNSVCCVAISADGKRLVAAGVGVWSWDLTESPPKVQWKATGPGKHYSAIALSPDGKTIAITDQQAKLVGLLDAATGEALRNCEGGPKSPPPGASRLGFSADGKTVFCGRESSPLRAWDVATGKAIDPTAADDDFLKLTANTEDGERRLGEDRLFLPFLRPVVSPETRTAAVSVRAPYPMAKRGNKRISANGRFLASVHRGEIEVWDLTTGNGVGPAGRIHGGVRHIAFSADGQRAVTVSMYSDVRVWNATTGEHARRLVIGQEIGEFVSQAAFVGDAVETLHYNPNLQPGAGRIATRTSTRWNPKTGESETIPVPGIAETSSAYNVVSPDGKWFAIARGGEIELRSRDGATARSLATTGGPDNTLTFSSDGTAVASTTNAGHVALFSLDGTPRFETKFREPVNEDEGYQNLLALSADGNLLAVYGDSLTEPKVEVHDVVAKKVQKILLGDRTIHKLALSPDGKRLAAGTSEGQVLIWDLPKTEPRVLTGHRGAVETVTFSPKGDRLASGSRDGTGLIWKLDD